MRKIRLAIETLEVTSFDTAAPGGGAGTVRGHVYPPPPPDTLNDTCECGSGGSGYPQTRAYTNCDYSCYVCELSADGGGAFTCEVNCFSHYTDCHRCV